MPRRRKAAIVANERLSPLSTPSATRAVLERHGLYTKYGLGQNFLVNDDVIRKILDLARVSESDRILEVGPGIGTLTAAMLGAGATVTAVEKDADLPAVLDDTLQPWLDRFTLLSMDALDVSRTDLIGGAAAGASEEESNGEGMTCGPDRDDEKGPSGLPNKLVSNLPYAVAATVVLDYLQQFDFLESATVMVQREVADRMMAQPGSKTYGAYTVKLGLYARPAGRFPVAPGNFFPPPRVESAVVRLDRAPACDESGAELTPEELHAACKMADAAFANRRKTIANSCKTYFASDPDTQARLSQLFERAEIDPKRRGESLAQQEFIRLAQAYLAG